MSGFMEMYAPIQYQGVYGVWGLKWFMLEETFSHIGEDLVLFWTVDTVLEKSYCYCVTCYFLYTSQETVDASTDKPEEEEKVHTYS